MLYSTRQTLGMGSQGLTCDEAQSHQTPLRAGMLAVPSSSHHAPDQACQGEACPLRVLTDPRSLEF